MKKIIFMMALLAGCCFWAEEAVGQSNRVISAKSTVKKVDNNSFTAKKAKKIPTKTGKRAIGTSSNANESSSQLVTKKHKGVTFLVLPNHKVIGETRTQKVTKKPTPSSRQ